MTTDFDIKKIIDEMAREEERAMARREVARAANKWFKICAGGSLDKVPDELAEALIDKIILRDIIEEAILSDKIQTPAVKDNGEITSKVPAKPQEPAKADKNKLWELFKIEMEEDEPRSETTDKQFIKFINGSWKPLIGN